MPSLTTSDPTGYLQTHAEIEWDSAGTPHSKEYTDIYWNPNQGIAEKQHVFIEANKLRQRWQDGSSSFTILEMGFGFGLNCLLAASLWQTIHASTKLLPDSGNRDQEALEPNPVLNLISIEKHPVPISALKKVYRKLNDSQLNPLANRLIEQYPEATRGCHIIWLTDDICLTLILDEAEQALTEIHDKVDAIFLDGFSPGKNEAMWNLKLLSHFPAICHSQTTLSTYSVSGGLRRGLTATGFLIEKQKGFGRKLEMLTAKLKVPETATVSGERITRKPSVIVVGAGISGLACAKALLKRGIHVQLFEKLSEPCAAASGIGQLAVYPHISVRPDPYSLFSLSAFQYSLREQHCNITGYAKFSNNKEEAVRFQRISDHFPEYFINGERHNDTYCLNHKFGAWLRVAEAYASTIRNLSLGTGLEIAQIEKTAGGWALIDAQHNQVSEASTVILATGHSALDILTPIELNANRGQAISIRNGTENSIAAAATPIISREKTLFPPDVDGVRVFSATNSRDSLSLEPDNLDTRELLENLSKMLDEPFELVSEQVGIRCTSRDRVPIVGRLPDWQALDQYCAEHRHRKNLPEFAAYEEGLYVCTAFGAHGATHAPLCGEYLTRIICGEPTPKSWYKLLNPERFRLRDRNKPD